MTALLLLSPILGLALLGAVVARRRRETGEVAFSRPVSALVSADQDLLPESGKDDGHDGLAAFYAYQMGVAKVHRH